MSYWYVLSQFPEWARLPLIASGATAASLAADILFARGVLCLCLLVFGIFWYTGSLVSPSIPMEYHIVNGPLYPLQTGRIAVDITNPNDKTVTIEKLTLHVGMCPAGTSLGHCDSISDIDADQSPNVAVIAPHETVRVIMNRPFIENSWVHPSAHDEEHDIFDANSSYRN